LFLGVNEEWVILRTEADYVFYVVCLPARNASLAAMTAVRLSGWRSDSGGCEGVCDRGKPEGRGTGVGTGLPRMSTSSQKRREQGSDDVDELKIEIRLCDPTLREGWGIFRKRIFHGIFKVSSIIVGFQP